MSCTQKSFQDTRRRFPLLYTLTPSTKKKNPTNRKQKNWGEKRHTVGFLLDWNEFGQTPGFVQVSGSICSDAGDHRSKQSKVLSLLSRRPMFYACSLSGWFRKICTKRPWVTQCFSCNYSNYILYFTQISVKKKPPPKKQQHFRVWHGGLSRHVFAQVQFKLKHSDSVFHLLITSLEFVQMSCQNHASLLSDSLCCIIASWLFRREVFTVLLWKPVIRLKPSKW